MKAPLDQIWKALNDLSILKKCTPGCRQMEPGEDGSCDIVMEVGIAAIKGRYTGKIRITDRIDSSQYRLAVTCSGNTGFVSAEGVVRLEERGNETIIEYGGQAQVGGLIAGVGQRVMQGIAKHLVGQFFECLEKTVIQSPKDGGRCRA